MGKDQPLGVEAEEGLSENRKKGGAVHERYRGVDVAWEFSEGTSFLINNDSLIANSL